jgi:hypothetical protein
MPECTPHNDLPPNSGIQEIDFWAVVAKRNLCGPDALDLPGNLSGVIGYFAVLLIHSTSAKENLQWLRLAKPP